MTSDSSAATTTARTLPWSQVVRGGAEPEPVSTSSVLQEQNLVVSDQSTVMELQQPPPPATTDEAAAAAAAAVVVESQSDRNASGVVKSAWNKQPPPSLVPNGGVVIGGAASWPALSESLTKSSESYGSSSVSVSQAPVVTQPPPKPVKSNPSHHSNQNHTRPAWQKSMKKGGGGGGAGGGYSQPPPSLPPPPPPMPPYSLIDMSYGGFVPAVLDSGVREQSPYNGSGFVPRPMASGGSHSRPPHDQSSNRKRNNFGPRPRGEGGSYVNNGHYVLLSNIYANKGLWKEVDRVRDSMKSLGMRKNPGCSWIEIKNKVHMLLAGDRSHPQMAQISEKMDSLGLEMKKAGCLPVTSFVLQDVEDQEKEHILCGHSEKFAVVLGILNTFQGSTLQVIKNLRICGDCHDVIKFISRFEQREIFVRDTNRFHHFKDGLCSCGDYW